MIGQCLDGSFVSEAMPVSPLTRLVFEYANAVASAVACVKCFRNCCAIGGVCNACNAELERVERERVWRDYYSASGDVLNDLPPFSWELKTIQSRCPVLEKYLSKQVRCSHLPPACKSI